MQYAAAAVASALEEDDSVCNRILILNQSGLRILPGRTRQSRPTPDVTAEYSGDLVFREVRVYNPRALLAPLAGRIGKHITDVLPPGACNVLKVMVDHAKTHHVITRGNYQCPDGSIHRVTVVAPDQDCVIVSLTKVL